jgi:hypothetical protein
VRVIIECKGRRQEYELKEGVNVIGRGAASDLRFSDPSLSRKHLQVELRGGEMTVRDLETHNGTFLGPQRIREAKLRAGVRLRAGNVRIRFEPSISPAQRAAEAAATGREHPELARAVPDAPVFQEAEDEATPVDANIVHAVAADVGAQAYAREGRWFMKDPATGEEIEIVPSGVGPAPAAAPPVQHEAARKVRKKLVLATAASLVAVLALVLVLGKLTSKPKGPTEYLSEAAVKAAIEESVKSCAAGKRPDAVKELKALLSGALHPRWRTPVKAFIEALDADAAIDAPAPKWVDKAVAAEKRWESLQKALAIQPAPPVAELARKRIDRIRAELNNDARLSEARRFLEKGDYTNAHLHAAEVDADSIFRKEAEPIVRQALDNMLKSVTAEADRSHWAEAIARGKKLLELRPELASELNPKLDAWARCDTDRLAVEQARKHLAESRYEEVIRAIASVDARGPYAKDAAALEAEAQRKGALQLAVSAYNGKEGEKALRLLAQGGDTDSQLVRKIQAVIKFREEGLQAIKDRKFDEAKDRFKRITDLETAQANQYAKEAQGFVANMDALVREQARILVQEANDAVIARDYRKARQKYEEAQRLDTTLTTTRDGLALLTKGAMKDYNWAINIEEKDPEAALQLFIEVRDRLQPVDKLHADAEVAIARLRTRLNKPAPAPAP